MIHNAILLKVLIKIKAVVTLLESNYLLEYVLSLTVYGYPTRAEYINVRQLFYQLMEQYVGKLHFLRLCERSLAKYNTMFNNSSRSILIASQKI